MISVAVFGFLGLQQTKSSFFPLEDSKLIFINIAYPGASPAEIEEGVVLKIEDNLRGLVDVDRVTSASEENSATITVDGKETRIKKFEYQLKRDVNDDRRPSSRTYIPLIKVTRDSLEDRGAILKWLSEPDQGKDVSINVYGDAKNEKKISEIKLTNSYIIDYHESYDLNVGRELTEVFQITAEKIDIDGNPFDEIWPSA